MLLLKKTKECNLDEKLLDGARILLLYKSNGFYGEISYWVEVKPRIYECYSSNFFSRDEGVKNLSGALMWYREFQSLTEMLSNNSKWRGPLRGSF